MADEEHYITDFDKKKEMILRAVGWTLDSMKQMDDTAFDNMDVSIFAKQLANACYVFCEKGCKRFNDCEKCWIHAGLDQLESTVAEDKEFVEGNQKEITVDEKQSCV